MSDRAVFRSPVLAEIERLDPRVDHERIVLLSTRVDFPFDTTRALELALFRTFAAPSIAALLHRTGEFEHRAAKRYEDTDIIVSEILEHGYSSERGTRAVTRMNAIHGRFRIPNEDFLYVLSTFVFEPIRWNERFGWRRLISIEKEALFRFWREVGVRMGIRDLPIDSESLAAFSRGYEESRIRHSIPGERVGAATRDLFASWFPSVLRPLVRSAIHVLLDERTREAFGFPRPRSVVRAMVIGSLSIRSLALRCWPRRKKPHLRTRFHRREYGESYRIEDIGPDEPSGAANASDAGFH
jgi:hypothetical protein